MPKYTALVACDPSAYGNLELEAATPDAALAMITRELIEQTADDVEYLGASNHRVVSLSDLLENGDDGELHAESVDVGADAGNAAPGSLEDQLKALIAQGLTFGAACNVFGEIQDRDEPHLAAYRDAVETSDELEVDASAIVSPGDDDGA